METLLDWASKWNIPRDALQDLVNRMGVLPDSVGRTDGMCETSIQNLTRLEASQCGRRLWRNNVGAAYDQTGRLVRYGLANDSAKLAKSFKSSDLIGITPITIEQKHVGQYIGVFTAYEVKKGGWSYKGKGREPAQFAFIKFVRAMGGIARFITSPKDIYL